MKIYFQSCLIFTLISTHFASFFKEFFWAFFHVGRKTNDFRSRVGHDVITNTSALFPFSSGRGCFLLSRLESKHTTRFDSMVFVMQHSGALKANTHGNPKKKNKHTSNSMSSGNLTYGKQTLQVLTWLRLLNCNKRICRLNSNYFQKGFILSRLESKHTTRFDSKVLVM